MEKSQVRSKKNQVKRVIFTAVYLVWGGMYACVFRC